MKKRTNIILIMATGLILLINIVTISTFVVKYNKAIKTTEELK